MSPPPISVLVPAYNAGAHLRSALESAASQEGPFETEILVVDDGSTDDTARQASDFPGVRLIRQANAGPSAARNRGIAEARGGLIALLDADDLWPPGRLAAQLAVLDRVPQAGLVFGDCRRFSPEGERPLSLFEESRLDSRYWGGPDLVSDPYAKLIRLNFIGTSSVLARRSCLQAVGGFDESLRHVEDLDLWLRLALVCPIAYTTQVCELKREHPGGLSRNREAMSLGYLRVLDIQRRRFPRELKRHGIRLAPLQALELTEIGHGRRDAGDLAGARRHYLAALRAWPSVRPLYYLAQSLLPRRPQGGPDRAQG